MRSATLRHSVVAVRAEQTYDSRNQVPYLAISALFSQFIVFLVFYLFTINYLFTVLENETNLLTIRTNTNNHVFKRKYADFAVYSAMVQ